MQAQNGQRHTKQLNRNHRMEYRLNVALAVFVCLNVLAFILETLPSLKPYQAFFDRFEQVSLIVFTVEYVCRLWTSVDGKQNKNRLKAVLKYALRPLMIIDLLAILPFYLSFSVSLSVLDLRFLRLFRLFRLMILLKIFRHSPAMRLMVHVFFDVWNELLVAIMGMLFLLVFSSTLVFYLEHAVQPDVFISIPHTMWWGIETLTTVGYGDMYPITPLGKILGACVALVGIGIFALPAAIFTASFSKRLKELKN